MTDATKLSSLNRRSLLKSGLVTLAAGGVSQALSADAQSGSTSGAPSRPTLTDVSSKGQMFWNVETTAGIVQGFANGQIKQFKGIPYGASTGGKNRFMPPKKPDSWTGVKDCIGFGPISPQAPISLSYEYAALVYFDRIIGEGTMNEDCLNLNIWTPGVKDGGKRAVMVNFHGGGWGQGSGNGVMYDGAQLALFGDVVVVSVNHRLGSFGYTHLGDLGGPEEFKYSGVAGVMDMIASLEWVRDNIENFGGDPDRIMIFGQSGGGSKVSTLMATPSAEGLFHRAAVQSGSSLTQPGRETGTAVAEKLLATLGIDKSNIAKLQEVSWQDMLEAQIASRASFWPIVDGDILPRNPFEPDAPECSKHVPLIAATTLHDASMRYTNFDVDDAGLIDIFRKQWGDKAETILAAYRAESPDESAFRIQGKAFTDLTRGASMKQAARKTALGGAPGYLYIYDWVSPMDDGRYGAVHCHDVDTSFYQIRSPISGSGDPVGRLMCERMASTWVAFAKTGNPNNPTIPDWPAYDEARRATMVFDEDTRVIDGYRHNFVELLNS